MATNIKIQLKCSACKEHRNKKEFSVNNSSKRGRQTTCKDCVVAIYHIKRGISEEIARQYAYQIHHIHKGMEIVDLDG